MASSASLNNTSHQSSLYRPANMQPPVLFSLNTACLGLVVLLTSDHHPRREELDEEAEEEGHAEPASAEGPANSGEAEGSAVRNGCLRHLLALVA